jgi:hypothetical protein
MVAMLQRLDARSFFFRSRLSGGIFLPLFLKVFRDRLSCHGLQCGRTVSPNLSCFGHSVTIMIVTAARQRRFYDDSSFAFPGPGPAPLKFTLAVWSL